MPKILKGRINPDNQIRERFQKILLKPSSKMLLVVWVGYFVNLRKSIEVFFIFQAMRLLLPWVYFSCSYPRTYPQFQRNQLNITTGERRKATRVANF
jgi:hypothetical protein